MTKQEDPTLDEIYDMQPFKDEEIESPKLITWTSLKTEIASKMEPFFNEQTSSTQLKTL